MKEFWRKTRKIIGIGRNYASHTKELGNQAPTELVLFTKPVTALLPEGSPIIIPKGAIVHHEVELAIVIGLKGKNISLADSQKHIAGFCISLDMTARNFQNELKSAGLPWDRAKGWDTSCPIGPFIEASKLSLPAVIWASVNDVLKQKASTKEMTFSINEIIAECSKVMTLEEGDIILTGTPSGVSEVQRGDVIRCGIEGVCTAHWQVAQED